MMKQCFGTQVPNLYNKKNWDFNFSQSVRKMATEKIYPLVKKMDEEEKVDAGVLQALFDNGVSLNILLREHTLKYIGVQ